MKPTPPSPKRQKSPAGWLLAKPARSLITGLASA